MPARSGRSTQEPVLGRAQGVGIVRPMRPELARLPGALELPIDQIVPDPGQPRQNWQHDDGDQRLEDLAASIVEFGILQPLLVRPTDALEGPPYQIVAGNRRFAAARRAGLATVPVVVRATDVTELRILQLTENLQRQDLAPLDEARAYQELIDLQQLTPRQLANRLHISDQQVRLRLRLLSDQVLADAVERRQIAANTARLIQQLPDDEQEPFRERVRKGERVQSNDLAMVRARLAAEGAVHPRRTRAPAARTAPVSLSTPTPDAGREPTAATGTMPVAPVARRQGAEGQSSAPSREPGSPVAGEPRADERVHARQAGTTVGSQMVFDPMPLSSTAAAPQESAGDTSDLQATLATLLGAADPRAQRLLRRLVLGGAPEHPDPDILLQALRLLSDLLRLLATEDPYAALLLRMLGIQGDE
jgi:ParB family transcriptional regulator, chromosome partitioning protein